MTAPVKIDAAARQKIACNACPVLCQITEGRSGACDRYANREGILVRVDPVLMLRRELSKAEPALVPFLARDSHHTASAQSSETELMTGDDVFITGVGSSTTYPDYKPAPFIVAAKVAGVDTVTVVTDGIVSYCS